MPPSWPRPCVVRGSLAPLPPLVFACRRAFLCKAAAARSADAEPRKEREPMPRTKVLKKGKDLELTIVDLAFGGKGVARVDGFPVFVDRGLPGEVLRARITKKRKSHAEARRLNTITPHRHAVDAPCAFFGSCGGCKLQSLAYDHQVRHKGVQVRDIVRRIGGFPDADALVHDCVPCDETATYRYRNKMEFSASPRAWTPEAPPKRGEGEPPPPDAPPEFHLGLHAPGRFDKVLPLDKCHLQHDTADAILARVVQRAPELGLLSYDAKTDGGFFRHLVLRRGNVAGSAPDAAEEDTFLAVLVTRDRSSTSDSPWEASEASAQEAALEALMDELVRDFPSLRSVYRARTRTRGIQVDAYERYAGDAAVYIRLLGMTFRISPDAFFQANTRQAERLYTLALDGAGLEEDDVALDLFCGTGSIGLCASQRCGKVVGYELVEAAVKDANANALANGVSNAEFVQGDLSRVNESLGGLLEELDVRRDDGRPPVDVVFVNPNRPGLHPDLCTWLTTCEARRIVYVSCNPSTLARDLALLVSGGSYSLAGVTPVDMFPQTPHVESVALLVRSA